MNVISKSIRRVQRTKDTQIVDTKSPSHKNLAVQIKYTAKERTKRYQQLRFLQARPKTQNVNEHPELLKR